LLALAAITLGCEASSDGLLVAVELESKENTLDGCTACGCRAKGELEPGTRHDWWVSFGLVTSDGLGSWKAVSASSQCGSGPFEKASSGFRRTLGTPYVVLHLSMTAALPRHEDIDLGTQLRIQKLSGFDKNGEPVYANRMQERTLSLSGEGDLTLPLLIPDEREKESFAVHEVLVRLRANVLGRGPAASYGILSVTSDVPGSEVLLDGGFVGRIVEDDATLLENVVAGMREVRVRDFSGREARREVNMEKGRTIEVALNVLDLTPAESPRDLVPIGKNPQGYEEYWRVRDRAIVVRIPEGDFLMGSVENEGKPDERPQHAVYTSEFLIDKTEVSWRQFRKFVEATGSMLPPVPIWGTRDDYPQPFVLWEEARAYCEWVGGRLPTEAEWEKAARGTDGRSYPWGDEWDPDRCNSISGGLHQPESVGAYTRCVSPYGVLDMAGSMWEWCADWYGEKYYAESSSRNPTGPSSGRSRVIRGGAWMTQPVWLRAAYRAKRSPSSRNIDHGFRCAQDPPEQVH
jgi:formylglycine-generating enzyme required for sulfatase activity